MKKESISVLIADDEPLAREAIKIYLANHNTFQIVAECEDGASALSSIRENEPDLVLLDIEMPELTGIQIVQKLKAPFPHVVFITAFEDYAVKAFEENAIDYILKPFNQDRFDKMLERVVELIKPKESRLALEMANTIREIKSPEEKFLKRITSKNKGKIHFIQVEEIVWIESAGSFSKLHMQKKVELTNFSVKQLEDLLDPAQFVRVHKSYMINLDHIQSIESYFHGEYILTMDNDEKVKLSRGYKNNLDRIINQYK